MLLYYNLPSIRFTQRIEVLISIFLSFQLVLFLLSTIGHWHLQFIKKIMRLIVRTIVLLLARSNHHFETRFCRKKIFQNPERFLGRSYVNVKEISYSIGKLLALNTLITIRNSSHTWWWKSNCEVSFIRYLHYRFIGTGTAHF